MGRLEEGVDGQLSIGTSVGQSGGCGGFEWGQGCKGEGWRRLSGSWVLTVSEKRYEVRYEVMQVREKNLVGHHRKVPWG